MPAAGRPDHDLLQIEMSDCILAQVAQLPERQRDALLLHHLTGFSHREIAERLGTSEGSARVILHRGQNALRTLLGNACMLDFADEIPCARR